MALHIVQYTHKPSRWMQKFQAVLSIDGAAWIGILFLLSGLMMVLYAVWFVPHRETWAVTPLYQQLPQGPDTEPISALDLSEQSNASESNIVNVLDENTLIIEAIGVHAAIHEGSEEQLARGLWHLPGTGTPLESNMVISSHRWMRGPDDPRSFFDLDELTFGDTIVVQWHGREYVYSVAEIREVNPDQVEVLLPTEEPRITLFTCAPLYSTERRLVVIAEQHFTGEDMDEKIAIDQNDSALVRKDMTDIRIGEGNQVLWWKLLFRL